MGPVLFRKDKKDHKRYTAFYFDNNRIKIDGYIEHPGLYTLTNNKLSCFFSFMIDTTFQFIEVTHKNLFKRKGLLDFTPFNYSGSTLNKELFDFWNRQHAQKALLARKEYFDLLEKNKSMKLALNISKLNLPEIETNPIERKSILKQKEELFNNIKSLRNTAAIDFLMKRPNSYLALDYFLAYVYRPNYSSLDETTLRAYVSLMGDTLKKTTVYQSILKKYKAVQDFCIGKTPPPFELPGKNGNKLNLKQFYGKIVLVNFWETGCEYCKEEHANLKKIYTKYNHEDFEIIGVSFENKKSVWADHIEKTGMSWHHMIDTSGYDQSLIIDTYGSPGIPSSFLLDKDGKVIAKNLRCPEYAKKEKNNINKHLENIFGF